MGALAVFLSREGIPDTGVVRSMLAAATHRGDHVSTERVGRVTLGVVNGSDWPTASLARHDDVAAAFHGNLDNHDELRLELQRAGRGDAQASTPAATLAVAFARLGPDFVGRLRGSFAGVVSDGTRAWLFRDHFGTRPFYCHDAPAGFYAATEGKQVLAGAPLSREPDLDHLHRVLFGSLDRSTAFKGVERIPERFVARVGPEPGLSLRRYWRPEELVESAGIEPEEAVEGATEALDRAVRRMLSGHDVLLLSGGLDSPALAAFAAVADTRPHPVKALTAVYPDHPSVDEREWTRMAASHVGMPLHCYAPSAGSLDDVAEWTRLVEGPIPALSIPESAESYREARALGARTVITGEIAEMLFEARFHLLGHLVWRGRFGAARGLIRAQLASGRSRRRIIRGLIRELTPPRLLPARLRTPRNARLSGLPEWVDGGMFASYTADPPTRPTHPRDRWSRVQTSPFRGPAIGFEADEICASACGVDVRRPFTDVDLWEFVLSLPAEVKFPDRCTKPFLRRVVRGRLPDALIDRSDKTYFDEFHLATADYATLERFLVGSSHRVEGIDYRVLEERIEGGRMGLYELQWAEALVRIHAFLDQW